MSWHICGIGAIDDRFISPRMLGSNCRLPLKRVGPHSLFYWKLDRRKAHIEACTVNFRGVFCCLSSAAFHCALPHCYLCGFNIGMLSSPLSGPTLTVWWIAAACVGNYSRFGRYPHILLKTLHHKERANHALDLQTNPSCTPNAGSSERHQAFATDHCYNKCNLVLRKWENFGLTEQWINWK